MRAPLVGIDLATGQEAVIKVANDGYGVSRITTEAGEPLRLVFATSNVTGCTRTMVIPDLKIERVLPVTGRLELMIPARDAGTTLRWICGMGMYSGRVRYE